MKMIISGRSLHRETRLEMHEARSIKGNSADSELFLASSLSTAILADIFLPTFAGASASRPRMVLWRSLSNNKLIAARRIGAKIGRILHSSRGQNWPHETAAKFTVGIVVNTVAVSIGWYLSPGGYRLVETAEQEFKRLHQNLTKFSTTDKDISEDQNRPSKSMESA